jgi:hypothetical protein
LLPVIFTKIPDDAFTKDQGSVSLIWEYELQDDSTEVLLMEFSLFNQDGIRLNIMSVDRNGIPSPGPGYDDCATFQPPATLIIDPVKTSDEGDISCVIIDNFGAVYEDQARLTIVPAIGECLKNCTGPQLYDVLFCYLFRFTRCCTHCSSGWRWQSV